MEGILPEELTLTQLKEKAVKLGMSKEEADLFTTKAPLVATIKILKKKRVETLTPPVSPKEEREDEQRWLSKAERMLQILLKQPRVRYALPLEPKEKPGVVREVWEKGRFRQIHISGAVEAPQINGCKWLVPKGVMVEIPKQVFDLLADSYNITITAGENLRLDRIDPATGRPVRDILGQPSAPEEPVE